MKEKVRVSTGSIFDKMAKIPQMNRMVWMDEPDLPNDMYYPFTQWSIDGSFILWNFEESDKSYRKRIIDGKNNE